MTKIKKIGVLTSGGDAPGMNAAIRGVTRTAIYNRLRVIGIRHGYEGMIHGHFKELRSHSVSDIIQKGGTILKTARSKAFRTIEGRKQAYENLKKEVTEPLLEQESSPKNLTSLLWAFRVPLIMIFTVPIIP